MSGTASPFADFVPDGCLLARRVAVAMPEFEVPQFYETGVAMRASGEELDREFRFMCAPASAIHPGNMHLLSDPAALLAVLGFEGQKELRVSQLPDAIFALLRADRLGEEAEPGARSLPDLVSDPGWLAGQREADPDAALFAEYLAFAEVVPFEQSPLRGHALASQAMKSYSKSADVLGLVALTAPLAGPGAPVVLLAVAGAACAVVVVDGIGVIAGVVTSTRTREIVLKVRGGIRGLIHRPRPPVSSPPSAEPAPTTPEPPDQEAKARAIREQLAAAESFHRFIEKLLTEQGTPHLGDEVL